MECIAVEEVFTGAKYDVIRAAMTEHLRAGRPVEYDERTWGGMLLVKHTLIATDKVFENDLISGMTDI